MDFANFLEIDRMLLDLNFHQRKNFMHDLKKFFFDEPYLYQSCANGMIHRCVLEVEMFSVLEAFHSSPMSGHHSGIQTAHKILKYRYYWRTINQDAHDFSKSCDRCQRDRGI